MSNDLKWSKHVTTVSAKPSKVLGIIKRNLWNCSKSVKTTPYTAIVRRKLEYACAASVPYLQKDIVKLEKIQRKAARLCTKNSHPTASGTGMLHDLGWTSLKLRRAMTQLTLLYKMSRGYINIDVNTYLNPHTERRTRGSHLYRYRQKKGKRFSCLIFGLVLF